MIELIINNFLALVGGILTISFGGYVTYRIYRKNMTAQACITFRNNVLTMLEGIYPDILIYLPIDEINTRIRQSVPKVVTVATEFRHFVPFYRKRTFDIVVKKYCDTAKNINWESKIAFEIYKESMSKPGDKSLKEIFKHAVDNLLKFAK